MISFRKLVLGAAVFLAIAAPAHAHRIWMLPSTFTLSGDEQWVTVDGAVSNDLFFPNHVPLRLDDVAIIAPDGSVSQPENGWTGKFRSTFDVKLDQQGTWKIAETGGLFFASWQEDGEMQRRRGTLEQFAADGLLETSDLRLMRSSRRVETFLTLGAPDTAALQPTGEGLELVPVTHPNDIYSGEEATFQFLLDGAPAAGLEVEIVKGHDRYRDDPGTLSVTSDEEGLVRFTLEEAGRYWLATRVEGESELDGRTIGTMTSYVATFEVLTL